MTDTPPHLLPAAEPAGGVAHYVPSEGRASPGDEHLDEYAADTDDPTGHADVRLDAAVLDALVGSVLDAASTPVHWAVLDAFDAGAAWAGLDTWVRWLARRYTVDHREIPPCWYAHGDLLEELSALHTAHQGAYHPDGAATGPADWHHQLAATRTRLNASVARTGCRPGEHRPPAPPAWAADPPPEGYATGLAGHITADLATRP